MISSYSISTFYDTPAILESISPQKDNGKEDAIHALSLPND